MLFLIILQTDSSECDVTYSPAFVCQHYLEKQTNWRKGAERKGKVNKCNWEGRHKVLLSEDDDEGAQSS